MKTSEKPFLVRRPRVGKYDLAVMAFIDAYWRENCFSPTYREIMDACGIKSYSSAMYVVRKVCAQRGDYIIFGVARGIIPLWVVRAIEAAVIP